MSVNISLAHSLCKSDKQRAILRKLIEGDLPHGLRSPYPTMDVMTWRQWDDFQWKMQDNGFTITERDGKLYIEDKPKED